MKHQVFDVQGMTCAACSARIEKVLARKAGVKSAHVNLASEKMTVAFDEDQISSQDIQEAVKQLGYAAREQQQHQQGVLPDRQPWLGHWLFLFVPPAPPSHKGAPPLQTYVLAGLLLALVFTVIALVHQVRLRRALQSLLARLLTRWRSSPNEHNPSQTVATRGPHDR